jgi:hypothetical protein
VAGAIFQPVIRLLITGVLLFAFIVFGMTVKIGSDTLFGHVMSIWEDDDVKGTVKPGLEKVERAGKKAYEELTREPDAGSR